MTMSASCIRGEDGYITPTILAIAAAILLFFAVFLSGAAAAWGVVLTRERLQADLYRAAYVAAEQGQWDNGMFTLDQDGAAAVFDQVFPVDAGLSSSWGPPAGRNAVSGEVSGTVILQYLQSYQASDTGDQVTLTCPASGRTTTWTIGAPGVLAAITAPIRISAYGVGVYDETLCLAAYASPPQWNAAHQTWRTWR